MTTQKEALQFVIGNPKGGVGKTTTTILLASAMQKLGFEVCVVDTDRAKNSQTWADLRAMAKLEQAFTVVSSGFSPATTVDQLKYKYDVIISDVGANDYDTLASLYHNCDLFLMPMMLGGFDVRSSFDITRELIKSAHRHKNGKVPLCFMMNGCENRFKRLELNIRKMLNDAFPEVPFLDSTIGSRISYKDISFSGNSIDEFPGKTAKIAYAEIGDLFKEVVEIIRLYKEGHNFTGYGKYTEMFKANDALNAPDSEESEESSDVNSEVAK